jgi:hypothetical protein
VEQAGNGAARAIDRDLATRWSGLGKGAQIVVDLGATARVCELGIAWYGGAARKSSFTIALSADGARFEQVYAGTSGGSTADVERYAVAGDARYVQITVNGNTQNDWASISEITARAQAEPEGFRHPGVLVSREQLEFVKARLAQEPWRTELAAATRSSLATRTPHAVPYPHKDEKEGEAERMDAIAAYTQAILWSLTGDEAYARRSIAILNAWSAQLEGHAGAEHALQAAWVAEPLTRAGELMRHTYTGWPQEEIANFERMLKTIFLVEVRNGWGGNGNWDLSMIEALMNIAVFTDDRENFDRAVAMWRARVPA